jgi:hypothetical protein
MNDLVEKYGFWTLNISMQIKINRTKQTAKEMKTYDFICLFSSTVSNFNM